MKILFADDNADLVRALKQILLASNYQVDTANNGEETLALVANNNYDLIILDIMMPVLDGISTLKRLRKDGIQTPVILLTAKSQLEDKIEGLDNGADDYITRPFSAKELLARIRAILRRRDSRIETLEFGDIILDPASFEVKTANKSEKLTRKEYQLLEYLIIHKDTFVSTQKLLDDVWNSNTDSWIETVWVFISNIRKKLISLNSNVEIESSRGIGYKIVVKNV